MCPQLLYMCPHTSIIWNVLLLSGDITAENSWERVGYSLFFIVCAFSWGELIAGLFFWLFFFSSASPNLFLAFSWLFFLYSSMTTRIYSIRSIMTHIGELIAGVTGMTSFCSTARSSQTYDVSSYYYICVLILLYMCLHTTI